MALVAELAGGLHARGRLEKRYYASLYCQGCEQFKRPADLTRNGDELENEPDGL